MTTYNEEDERPNFPAYIAEEDIFRFVSEHLTGKMSGFRKEDAVSCEYGEDEFQGVIVKLKNEKKSARCLLNNYNAYFIDADQAIDQQSFVRFMYSSLKQLGKGLEKQWLETYVDQQAFNLYSTLQEAGRDLMLTLRQFNGDLCADGDAKKTLRKVISSLSSDEIKELIAQDMRKRVFQILGDEDPEAGRG